jgi:hypothetical protein
MNCAFLPQDPKLATDAGSLRKFFLDSKRKLSKEKYFSPLSLRSGSTSKSWPKISRQYASNSTKAKAKCTSSTKRVDQMMVEVMPRFTSTGECLGLMPWW